MNAKINTQDFALLRNDFPILSMKNRNKPVIYFDSASSAQKPRAVVDAIAHFYYHDYANIHRGIYELSERASELYEKTRLEVQQFINAQSADEIIFVRGTTEGINLVANGFTTNWQAGDEVILSEMEHHSNIVPWYFLREKIGIVIKVIPIDDNGALNSEAYQNLFSSRTKLVALAHASNVLGTINPVKEMIAFAHQHDVPVLLDGAQAVPHMPVDVKDLDCDFYAFSAHKLYGPSGVGILYGKKQLLEQMIPYQGGGGMIEAVSFDKITFAKSPHRFEAGTPHISGVIGLGAAIHYVQAIGLENIFAHEQSLLDYAEAKLLTIPGLRIIGNSRPKVGVISFVLADIHPHDIGSVLDHEGIAIRVGHHCAMPLMQRFKVPATARISFGVYNNEQEIDALISGLQLVKRFFA